MEDYIYLQNAHCTQHIGTNGKSDWSVQKNISNEEIYTLPSHISDADIFTIMRFARHFELKAFNAGIKIQKEHQNSTYKNRIRELEELVCTLLEKNDVLSNKLSKLLVQEK